MSNKPNTIMIIEDEQLLLDIITRKIETHNIDAISCLSGEEALEKLKNIADDSKLPNAIWLDYYLKGMSGLEFINEVKKEERLSKIPIIVVSNTATQEKINLMLSLGAAKYMIKAEHRLDHIINEIFEIIKRESRRG